jgi:hypothetical protein
VIRSGISQKIADYAYAERQGRAVAVDVRGLPEALRQVYDAGPLVEELLGQASGASR